MSESSDFADVLQNYVNQSSYSAGQLARLTGIPKPTILSWLDGRVKHPRSYSDLVKLSESLRLKPDEATHLLAAAGFMDAAERLQQTGAAAKNDRAKTAVSSTPFQAIPILPYFVGRQSLIKQIEETLLTDPTVHACCLQGMAGAGKTALAAQIAYRLRPHFPDGVLWANPHRTTPMTILAAFGNAYGENLSQYADLESRSQVVRQLLADKRILVVLDDVWHGQDILPLLPPSTKGTAVLITTRRQDLFATAGMRRLTVGPFDASQQVSLKLFNHFLGDNLTNSNEELLSQIAELLGHLPLAIAIAASRLAYEPSWSPAAFLDRLVQTQQLSELEFEDQSVQISFSTSFALLDDTLQTFFGLMGLFGGREFTSAAAAAVAQTSQQQAEDRLRKLYALSLCQLGRTGVQARYRLHPLLSKYAEETAVSQLNVPEAHLRLINYFVDYGEKHHDQHEMLTAEINNVFTVLELAQKYSLPDAYRRCQTAFAPVLGKHHPFT
ncbi:MAG: hypothetical protein H6656_12110 [Ardenticatenaceae bacterium]|nr:hypothetical protein [Ardenticatenaceae bacterium]